MIQKCIKFTQYIWAAPNTGLGALLGLAAIVSGGHFRFQSGCLEFDGGCLSNLLNWFPPAGVRAMTLGHTIVGIDAASMKQCRRHEHVHVRQYEKWGPFFIPAYLSCSAYLWVCRRDYYRENPFEVEAFENDVE